MYCWNCGRANKVDIPRCTACGADLLHPDIGEKTINVGRSESAWHGLFRRKKDPGEVAASDTQDLGEVSDTLQRKRRLRWIPIVLLAMLLFALGIAIYAIAAPYHFHYVIECLADDLGIRTYPELDHSDEVGMLPTPTPTLGEWIPLPTPAPREWEVITFGRYEQDNISVNGPEEIEWIVLDRQGSRSLLLSRFVLDCYPLNTKKRRVTWETSTLRDWLNGAFIEEAFTQEERDKILSVTVNADENPYSGADPGESTQDSIFLLSSLEAKRFFSSDADRRCVPTLYARARGADGWGYGDGACDWWTRTPGDNRKEATVVSANGIVGLIGNNVNENGNGVRPTMWIDTD